MTVEPSAAARRYRIGELVGEGAYGRVYRAVLEEVNGIRKDVAIKVSKDANPLLLERLRMEARTLARLHSDAIVRVEGMAEVEGRPAIVMELVHGASLDQLPKPPPRVVIELALRVAQGLEQAFTTPDEDGEPMRLVHRDVKPGNIMLTAQGQVKIIDFGLAQPQRAAGRSGTAGVIHGTLEYMSPERARGAPSTHRGDLYALGALLMELLRGEPWVSIGGDAQEHGRVLDRRLSLLADTLGAQGDIAAALVGNLLAYNPDDRPDAAHLIPDCERLMSSLSGPSLAQWARQELPKVLAGRPPGTRDTLYGRSVGELGLAPPPPPPPHLERWKETADRLVKAGVKLTALLAMLTALVKTVDVFIHTAKDSDGARVAMFVIGEIGALWPDSCTSPGEGDNEDNGPFPPPPIVEPDQGVTATKVHHKKDPPPPTESATLKMSGDATSVGLRRGGRSAYTFTAPDRSQTVTPGSYEVIATFHETGAEEIRVGDLTVHPGARLTVDCDETPPSCRW